MNTASFRLDQLSEQNPWPGLRAFTEADREFFFGREHEAAELLSLVQRAPVVVLYGQSGLGKTSLIQAGLFPALKRLNFLPLRLRFDQSDNAPPLAQQLKNALAGELDRAGIAAPRPGQDETLWEYFHRRDADFWGPRNRLLSPVIVFDQFEEVFTLGQRSEHAAARVRQFAAELESLLEHRPPDSIRERLEANPDEVLRYDLQRQSVKFVLSLREDFLPNLDPWRVRMPSLLPHRFRLERMTGAEALEVVQRAGQQLVEPAVARDIVDFVSTSQRKRLTRAVEQRDVEPALLSVVCDELNRRRLERGQAQITSDLLTLEREGIIRGFYERAFNGVDARVRDWVEDELLTASGFRDRAALEDALKLGLPTVGFDQLVDRRILHREEREGVIWLELTHDLLADPAQHSRTVREQRRQVQAAAERERELEHQREVQRRRARLLAGLSVGLALLCLAILGGLWRHWYNYDRPYVLYYKHFTKRWGIPHGIGLLDKGQIEHRRSSLRFTYRGKRGPLIRVQAVDYAGRLTYRHDVGTYLDSAPGEKPDRECQWEFIFDTKGGVAYEMAYDKRSNLVWGFVYSPATADKTERVAHFVGPNGLPRPLARSSADYVRFEYTPDGLEKRLSYSDSFGRPQPRPDLAFSVSMQYDTAGRLVRAESRDARGRLMLDDTKSAILTIAYDGQGNPVEENWLNPEGQPTLTADGYARIKADYDEWGNWTKCAYGDTDGNPTIVRPGYFRVAARYDPRGNQTEWACFDTHGQPTVEKSGGYHAVRKEYDDRGDWTNCVYVGVNGRETIGKIGYSRISARYDEKGNQLAWACFDARGQAATDRSDGSHMLKSRYDSLGHRIEAAYFGLRGEPVNLTNGYARWTARYDESGHQLEWSAYGTNGQPAWAWPDGYHSRKMTYDERGNQIEWACFDKAGQPMNLTNGYWRWTARYDDRGHEIEWACYGTNGQPAIKLSSGYHMTRTAYDERGNQIEWTCFDSSAKPVRGLDGYAKLTKRYDDAGHLIEWACFDADDQPAAEPSDGTHMLRNRYDDRGNRIEAACFGLRGEPMNLIKGYARWTARYDIRDDEIEWACFDANNRPAIDLSGGYHRWRGAFDERGNQIEVAYFDTADKLLRLTNGFAKVTMRYDLLDRMVEWACHDTNGQPALNLATGCHKTTAAFDDRGNQIEWACFGISGKPMNLAAGYAKWTARYDEANHQVEWACFDENGQPAIDLSNGYHLVRKAYDERGQEIEESYFDTADKPMRLTNGFAKITTRYDSEGNQTAPSYFDESGKPLATEVYIVEVLSEGQAQQVGLRQNDVILSYDGKAVPTVGEFIRLTLAPGGSLREMRVWRNGRVETSQLKPGRVGISIEIRAAQLSSDRTESPNQ